MVLKKAFPRPDFERKEWLNLNGTWDFSFEEGKYDRKIEVPYPWGSPLSQISEADEVKGYYRTEVTWNPENERIFLIFGAVDYLCTVFVNGEKVCTHQGGYDEFQIDVTENWKRNEKNIIEVAAVDEGKDSQTYGKQGYGNARGIWQTVRMEARPQSYIENFCIKTKMSGEITVEITAENAKDGDRVTASFGENQAEGTVKNGKAVLSFTVKNPKLWSPDTPYLYEGTLSLSADAVFTYFGIREIGTDVYGAAKNRYITLNGKPVFINATLDQSFNPRGFFTLPSDEDCREEIERLKNIGLNGARIHIKAEEPLKLYYADKLGMLILEDIPCFWGAPLPETKAQYEKEMEKQVLRDRNHPAVFYWVVFNETWGLFDYPNDKDKKVYTDETAKWVISCCERVRSLDDTRLIEDNSPCNGDHTVTDVNTWHFYRNGYGPVKKAIDDFCETAYVGSPANFKKGYVMADVPCMNSECGAVWGVDGNAGESDISWQYKYMINEMRLHDKLCGFVFTEFHDVVNEFNGYYKLNNEDKDFGYEDYGMTLQDLHSQDYVGFDCLPMQTVKAGQSVLVPLFASSFSDEYHGKKLTVSWEFTMKDPLLGGAAFDIDSDEIPVVWGGYGYKELGVVSLTMPDQDGPAVLSWSLLDGDEIIMRNCVFFDVEKENKEILSIEPKEFVSEGFEISKTVQEGNKVFGLGSGGFRTLVNTSDIPSLQNTCALHLVFEAATREPMSHDYPEKNEEKEQDLSYMLGYRIDPGANRNSFKQTDEETYPGDVEIYIDGEKAGSFVLPDDPADARGLLSSHYQASDRLLDEAGTYGYLCDLKIPSGILLKLKKKDSFELTLSTKSGHGLSLFGRKSGRYGIGVVLEA